MRLHSLVDGPVQFIGGEPTLYRRLLYLIHRARCQGLEVEVFSNLVRVSPELWEVFAQGGVRLATSYYTDDAVEHEAITKGRNNHARTKANIIEVNVNRSAFMEALEMGPLDRVTKAIRVGDGRL